MTEIEGLVNKTVELRYTSRRLEFSLSHALFSSFDIDIGTKLLLKEAAQDPVIGAARLVLDAGCGTGIIGIALAATTPGCRVVLQDRDMLACEFSLHNCKKNGISASLFSLDGSVRETTVDVRGEGKFSPDAAQVLIRPGILAEHDVIRGYDAVLSNVPAKAGPPILTAFFSGCESRLLRPGGRLAFVIVNSLIEVADSWCAATPMRLIKRVPAKSHTVFILEKAATGHVAPAGRTRTVAAEDPREAEGPRAPVPDRWPGPLSKQTFDSYLDDLPAYIRSDTVRPAGRHTAGISGFWGLPEFDTSSYATDLAIETLESALAGLSVKNFLVYEPGIGLSAVWASQTLVPSTVAAVSRNLLSLLATKHNLDRLAEPHPEFFPCPATEIGRMPGLSVDCALWFCDEIPEYNYVNPSLFHLRRMTKEGATAVLVGSAAAMSRFDRARPNDMRRIGLKKRKGFSALVLTKAGR